MGPDIEAELGPNSEAELGPNSKTKLRPDIEAELGRNSEPDSGHDSKAGLGPVCEAELERDSEDGLGSDIEGKLGPDSEVESVPDSQAESGPIVRLYWDRNMRQSRCLTLGSRWGPTTPCWESYLFAVCVDECNTVPRRKSSDVRTPERMSNWCLLHRSVCSPSAAIDIAREAVVFPSKQGGAASPYWKNFLATAWAVIRADPGTPSEYVFETFTS